MIVHLAWASQTSIMGKEPTFLYQGETNVSREYYAKLKTTPLDVVDKKPVYLATFGNHFLNERTFAGFSSTRIAVTEYGNTNQRYASPRYIVEFPEESINKVPKSITDALVKHYKIDLNPANLFKELKKNGVENIFITACGFGPIPNSSTEFRSSIMLCGFLTFQYFRNDDEDEQDEEEFVLIVPVFTGIFDSKGVIPWSKNPIQKNALESHYIASDEHYINQVLGCQFVNINGSFASFYVLAVTSDKKNILITQVFIMNNKSRADEISNLFRESHTFIKLLETLTMHAKTFRGLDQQVLKHNRDSLATMSGNEVNSSLALPPANFIPIPDSQMSTNQFKVTPPTKVDGSNIRISESKTPVIVHTHEIDITSFGKENLEEIYRLLNIKN